MIYTILKWIKWFIISIISLVVLLFFLLQIPAIQNFIAGKAVEKANEIGDFEVSLERVHIASLKNIHLQELYLGTKTQDTIVNIHELKAQFSLLKLLNGKIYVEGLQLVNGQVNLVMQKSDSLLNLVSVFPSGDKEESSEESGSPPDLFLASLKLSNIQFQYKNEIDSSEMQITLGGLNLSMEEMDLQNQFFLLQNLNLEDVDFRILQFATMSPNAAPLAEEAPEVTQDENSGFNIGLSEDVKASNINFMMENQASGQKTSIQNAGFVIVPDTIDLPAQKISVKTLDFNNAVIEIHQGNVQQTRPETPKENETNNGSPEFTWNIDLAQLNMDNNSFRLSGGTNNSPDSASATEGLFLKNIRSRIKDISVSGQGYKADVGAFSLIYNDQLELKNFKGAAFLSDQEAYLHNGVIELISSRINLNADVNYPAMNEISKQPKRVKVSTQIDGRIDFEELRNLNDQVPLKENFPVGKLNVDVEGTLAQLLLKQFTFQAGDLIDLELNGSAKNLTGDESQNFTVNLNRLYINNELLNYLPDSLAPENLTFQDSIVLRGKVAGNAAGVTSNINLATAYGALDLEAMLDMDTVAKREYFDLALQTDSFNLGKFLNKEDTLGLVSLNLSADGSTQNFKSPEINMQLNVSQFEYVGYEYQNITLNGDYAQNKWIKADLIIDDPNVLLDLSGELDQSREMPTLKANLMLKYLNMGKLNLSANPMFVKGNLIADITGDEWNELDGYLHLDSLEYESDLSYYSLDSLNLTLAQKGDSSKYTLLLGNLFQSDSLLVKTGELIVDILGNKANLDFRVEKGITKDDEPPFVHGKGNVSVVKDSIDFTANFQIASLQKQYPLDFNLEIQHTYDSALQKRWAHVRLLGEKTSLDASGYLQTLNQDTSLNAQIAVDSLNLDFIATVLQRQFKKLEGGLTANFDVQGSPAKPKITGQLNFRNLLVNPRALSTDLLFEDETIILEESALVFDKIDVLDKNKNRAVLDGRIDLFDSTATSLNLSLEATKFQLLNKDAMSDDNFFGNVRADLDASISGSLDNLNMEMDVGFKYNSEFTYVISQEQKQSTETEGIVVMAGSAEQTAANDTAEQKQEELVAQTRNLELNSSVNFTDKMQITIITDPATDERLQVSGNGDLNFKITENGSTNLTGRYEISSGIYRLKLYEIVNRDFNVQEGSYLSWTGDIMGAYADITAVYEVRTSTIGLMQNRVGSAGGAELSRYYERIPVKVLLHMQGELLSPDEIRFELSVDPKYAANDIQSAIESLNSNESERNKQVISLLVFGSFMGADAPGDNRVSYALNNKARQTVGNLISQQLNKFSNQYIKGVNVNFDIQSYQAYDNQTSARTDVSLDLSRSLFNNRLTIQVGGSLEIEEGGGQDGQSYQANQLAGDFLLEYKLTPDGVYRFQAFRKNEYENVIDGLITQTGVALIFNKDFYKFMDLFKPKTKTEESEEDAEK